MNIFLACLNVLVLDSAHHFRIISYSKYLPYSSNIILSILIYFSINYSKETYLSHYTSLKRQCHLNVYVYIRRKSNKFSDVLNFWISASQYSVTNAHFTSFPLNICGYSWTLKIMHHDNTKVGNNYSRFNFLSSQNVLLHNLRLFHSKSSDFLCSFHYDFKRVKIYKNLLSGIIVSMMNYFLIFSHWITNTFLEILIGLWFDLNQNWKL